MSIYMKINGIDGSVSSSGHEQWIEIQSFHFLMGRSIATKVGDTGDRRQGWPFFQEILVEKKPDISSAYLFSKACEASVMDAVQIDVCSTGKSLQPYSMYKLSNVIISEYHDQAHSSSDYPVERLKLNYTKLEKHYVPRDAEGNTGSPIIAGYDLISGQVS